MHACGLVHGDIHAVRGHFQAEYHVSLRFSHQLNILIDDDEKAVLSDFGLSHTSYQDSQSRGMYRYMASELLSNVHNFHTTPASDVWAFAVTMLELGTLNRPHPFFTGQELSITPAVGRGELPARLGRISDLYPSQTTLLSALMERMWHPQPDSRPTISFIVPYLSHIFRDASILFSSVRAYGLEPCRRFYCFGSLELKLFCKV